MLQAQSVTVWRQANSYVIPRVAFMNKMDKNNANFTNAVESMKNKLHTNPLPVQYPLGTGKEFGGVCDLVEMKVLQWKGTENSHKAVCEGSVESLGQDLLAEVKQARSKLVEEVAMHSNEAMAKMFANKDNTLSTDELLYFIRKLTHNCSVVPVLCGSALKNKGVQPLMDAILYYLPSPVHGPSSHLPDVVEKLCAFAFKVIYDHQRGPVVFVRIYRGSLTPHSAVYNMTHKCRERISRLLWMFADEQREVAEMTQGNIAALVGLKNTYTGDVLVASADVANTVEKKEGGNEEAGDRNVLLRGLEVPEPVFFRTIEPYSAAEQQDLDHALNAISREDPSLKVSTDLDSGQTILSGMGELHLDVVCNRIRHDFKLNITLGAIQVSYREAPSTVVTECCTMDRTIGNRRHVISIKMTVTPLDNGGPIKNVEFTRSVKLGITKEMMEAVTHGILQSCSRGPLLSFPIINAQIKVEEMSVSQDSSPAMGQACATQCITKAFSRSDLVLLEPVMAVEVVTPDEHIGIVLGDLSSRRAAILNVSPREDMKLVMAHVPLACLIDYATVIRTETSGMGSHSVHFSHYTALNSKLTQSVITKIRGF
ncbi:ribosome-releasing factor 2, mitochondrial-like isoform X2 [Dysidea avara]|uniref:ribosome-releasing factor 2, mitochondrial-like isoform X2 n=1 Tax=Dysidea avara TaxID=196820 RepID=UPI003332F55F